MQRCTSGTSNPIGRVEYDLRLCVLLCDSIPNCEGINYRPHDKICIGRTNGCVLTEDDGAVFLARRNGIQASIVQHDEAWTTRRSRATTTSTTTTVAIPPPTATMRKMIGFKNYQILERQRCSGGSTTRIGPTLNDLAECKQMCDVEPDCVGFNWRPIVNICVARTRQCTIEFDKGGVFFKKFRMITSSVAGIKVDEHDWQDSLLYPDYRVSYKKQCIGGQSTLIGESPTGEMEDCLKMCQRRFDCYGWTWYPKPRHCVVRTKDCILLNEETGALMYRRVSDANLNFETKMTPEKERKTAKYPVMWGFELKLKTHCLSGSSLPIGEIRANISECASLCNKNQRCAGFNVEINDGLCALRSHGCQEHEKEHFIFYEKVSSNPEMKNEKDLLKRFDLMENSRCTGGSSHSIGMTNGFAKCLATCYQYVGCFGFNFVPSSGTCALRSFGCISREHNGMMFYVKHQ